MFNENCKTNKLIGVLIIADTECEEIGRFLSRNQKFSICECAGSGIDLTRKIDLYKPDVVIAECSASDKNGENVLKKLNCLSGNKPKIIALSSSENTNELEESFKSGANYYIRKPIIFSLLEDAIISVCGGEYNGYFNMGKIKKFVRLIGVPTNILGYVYICEALNYMFENSRIMFLNEVYKLIAKNNITSSESVEVSIRNAVKKAVKLKNSEFEKVFGDDVKSLSNSQFLTIVKEILFERGL